ncbi:MAG: hypothetical protein HZC01_04505 [Candidatus Kerfeldbacteria bacterium]|nr:hypothetical protein [Candidatus Kerfeldbacteria bacterium]
MSGVVGGSLASLWTADIWKIIYVASLCDVLGFYGYFVIRDLIHFSKKMHHLVGLNKYVAVVWTTIQALTVEFGVSEAVDTVFVRPACIFFAGKFVDSLLLQCLLGIAFSDLWMMGVCPLFYRARMRLVEQKLQHKVERKVESM